MKKIFTTFLTILFCATLFAADLNPFAYGLRSEYEQANYTLTVYFSLNAPANKVQVIVNDGEQDYIMRDYRAENDPTGTVPAGNYQSAINVTGLPKGKSLTWRVDVYGFARSKMTQCTTFNQYQQFSIDIDNNPKSPYFGRILVAQPVSYDNDDGRQNAGIYEYTPRLTQESDKIVRYSGGVSYVTNADWYNKNHVSPHRVRIAQDGTGRIYASSCDMSIDAYLWYINPANLNEWKVYRTPAQMQNTHGATGKLYNCGLDVRGEGDDITLLLYSGLMNTSGVGTNTNKVYACEYQPIKGNIKGLTPAAMTRATCAQTNAQYDQFGAVWYINYNANVETTETGLKHVTINGVEKGWSTSSNFQSKAVASAGFRHNIKEHKVAISQWNNGSTFAIYKLYDTDPGEQNSTRSPLLYSRFVPETNVSSGGSYIEDFAWDYAGNLYVCTRKKVFVYADTLSANRAVSTPTRNVYNFVVQDNGATSYRVTVKANDDAMGTVEGGGVFPAGQSATLIARPKKGYEFKNWTKGSTVLGTYATLTYTPNSDVEIFGNFQAIDYKVTWWNLFKDNNDISLPSANNPKTNERLWRLLQKEFASYRNVTIADQGMIPASKTQSDYDHFAVAPYLHARTSSTSVEHSGNYFLDETKPFYWMGKYMIKHGIRNVNSRNIWSYAIHLLINRSNYTYNLYNGGSLCNNMANGAYDDSGSYTDHTITWDDFTQYGTPDYWRPWWTLYTCELDTIMVYTDNMPIDWKRTSFNNGNVTDVPNTSTNDKPDNWYQWNTASKENQLLAWRDGADGPIVHHVSRQDMALYATYVDKSLQEDDPAPSGKHDASNDDVLRLLANPNYGSTEHNISVDRSLVGGMYNTICLPFDVYNNKLPAFLSEADIKKFSGVEQKYEESGDPVVVLNFVDVQPTADGILLEAGKPYLVNPKEDVPAASMIYQGVKWWNVLIDKGPYIETGGSSSVEFHGVFNPTSLSVGDYILVADNRLAKVTNTSDKLKGYRGYFIINDPWVSSLADKGNVYFSFKKPVTTSVPVAPEAEHQHKPEVRKIMYDGKIYILRGNEVYTITGNRVR